MSKAIHKMNKSVIHNGEALSKGADIDESHDAFDLLKSAGHVDSVEKNAKPAKAGNDEPPVGDDDDGDAEAEAKAKADAEAKAKEAADKKAKADAAKAAKAAKKK